MEGFVNRFIRYIKKNTRSDASKAGVVIPSTASQMEFLEELYKELKEIGLEDVKINKNNAFLTATVPANTDNAPVIGFISHVDTADFNAENISPQIHENYDGGDIALGNSGFVLSPKEFPNLKNYIGQTLITTDGTTLLGADDKAGVCEIVSAMEYLINNPQIKHGKLRIAFGCDEEVGVGSDNFDVEDFGCDFAYTMDGSSVGELQFECFNAAEAKIDILGKSVHPGDAKNKMINALTIARDIQMAMPLVCVPEKTECREGFIHLVEAHGNVENAELTYIIRDHNKELFEDKKNIVKKICEEINAGYDIERVKLSIHDEYRNMADIINNDPRSVDIATKAMENLGITVNKDPIRGGTDGSKISFKGLPTPNIFAGGENFHGRFEFVSVQSIQKAIDVIVEIAKIAAEG
ncbi:peptidase T [Lachnoanaerobaculum sp. Marseille-Q4761]|jgi:peptidase T|uniref:peptidase T n=1 Tax=Lachnoanaerobaculum sp. Marseille-Q4761 TaxID=2819511 RepID=UPI001AA1710C|nr:peptidase T [Lachnoanaerobaculum sp. Marseille-Q4761]MBO1870037.1 peptidase T [Lachnoanaerobaculum sp. Marseille-Q4761]